MAYNLVESFPFSSFLFCSSSPNLSVRFFRGSLCAAVFVLLASELVVFFLSSRFVPVLSSLCTYASVFVWLFVCFFFSMLGLPRKEAPPVVCIWGGDSFLFSGILLRVAVFSSKRSLFLALLNGFSLSAFM